MRSSVADRRRSPRDPKPLEQDDWTNRRKPESPNRWATGKRPGCCWPSWGPSSSSSSWRWCCSRG